MRMRLCTPLTRAEQSRRLEVILLGLACSLIAGPSARAAEDFVPTASVVIDAAAGKWNSRPLPVSAGRLTMHFNKVQIPAHVQVTFRGFRSVVLSAAGPVEVAGAVTVEAGPGGHGEDGRGGQGGRGGPGGTGYGAGLPGQGGSPNGEDGPPATGDVGPGHPERRGDGACTAGCADPAGGAAGGSNGTVGGRGIGCWLGLSRYWEADVLGRDDAFDTGLPAGGGSGGGGGCRREDLAGGGGGGGGSSGSLEIRSEAMIRISGQVRVQGGNGGRGGDGARTRPGDACGAEANRCAGGGGGGAGGAGGYISLQATAGEIVLQRERDFDVRAILQANGGGGGQGGEGNPTGAQGPPGGGGRIRLVARGGVYKVVGGARTVVASLPGRPPCWIAGQSPNCALSSLPGLASIYVAAGVASGRAKEYIYVNGQIVARVEH